MFIGEHLIQCLYSKKLGMLFWRLLFNTFLKFHNLFKLLFWDWRKKEVGGREESEMFVYQVIFCTQCNFTGNFINLSSQKSVLGKHI